MNQLEKAIYNKYLAVTRSSINKPFTLRKDFEEFEQHKDYPYVVRLTSFFNRFPQIDHQKYFEAPFKIYSDEQYFDLKFYTSQKAIKTYSIYLKQIQDQDPDTAGQLKLIADSLRFITKFCFYEKILLEEYLRHKSGATFSWTKHLKNHEVSIYALYGFNELQQVINEIPKDELQLLLGGVIDDIWKYKIRFHKSTKAKELIARGFDKVKKILAADKVTAEN